MQPVFDYTLPPDKLIQALELARIRTGLHFGGLLISVLVLIAIIQLRIVPRMLGRSPLWIVLTVTAIGAIFDLPAEMFGHATSLRYHISIQGWPSWFLDWTKGQAVGLMIAVVILVPFYALLRRKPTRWWIYAWLVSIPVMLVSAYLDPLILEPLFNNFQPLAAKHPELIDPIEKLLHRARIVIPHDHLFEMDASAKTNALNAYVSGFGPSRRMVLYDTIIRKEQGPPLLDTIGHELGHEALRHIPKGLAFGSFCLLIGLFLLSKLLPWVVDRWGSKYRIYDAADWTSLPVLLLLATLLGFLSEPIANGFSRHVEHQADVFGLEVTHDLVPDIGQAAAQAFQVEGETTLDDPSPNPLVVFWLYSHPPVRDRLRFALHYDPWKIGVAPEFVP